MTISECKFEDVLTAEATRDNPTLNGHSGRGKGRRREKVMAGIRYSIKFLISPSRGFRGVNDFGHRM